MVAKTPTPSRKLLTKAFNDLLDEYVKTLNQPDEENNAEPQHFEGDVLEFDQGQEIKAVRNFLASPCKCGQN